MADMRRVGWVLVLLLWPAFASAQAPDASGIRAVITRQLEAMNRDDQAGAFAIASPTIQQMFQDAPTFMTMVERGYPQVHRSRRHQFLKLDSVEGRLVQRVLIESDAGTVVGRYEMIEIDGSWRINGFSLEKYEGA